MEILKEKGIVQEMAGSESSLKIEVPLAKDVNVEELIKGDKDPLFVTVEAMNPQVSKNRRIWNESIINNVAEQILAKRPDAYQGHLKESDRASVTPTAMTIWLGATVKKVSGKSRLFIKGYVLPYAKELRQYLKAAKATGKKVAVSVYGQAEQKWNDVKKAYDVLKFDLESIDWARPGSEGVLGTGYLGLASEMKGEDIMDREEVLKSVTVSEMEENNPKLVKSIKDSAVKETKESVVSEMEGKINTIQEMVNAYEEALPEGVEKKPEVVKEMVESHSSLVESYLDSVLEKKVTSSPVRSIVKKQIVSEMAGQFMTKELVDSTVDKTMQSEEVKGIIQEMKANVVINPAQDNRNEGNTPKFIKK